VIHDRDSIFSAEVDKALEGFGVTVLKTPVRSPVANAFCERLIGTIRRACLDYLIPFHEDICGTSFVSSWLTTIEAGHIPRWGRASPNRTSPLFPSASIDIDCLQAIE
jgi:hypothetical protein